jgi:hypothetical protein
MQATDISSEIEREKQRRVYIADAARRAAAETGRLNGPGKDFCELSYIIGAMAEAGMEFDARH